MKEHFDVAIGRLLHANNNSYSQSNDSRETESSNNS